MGVKVSQSLTVEGTKVGGSKRGQGWVPPGGDRGKVRRPGNRGKGSHLVFSG